MEEETTHGRQQVQPPRHSAWHGAAAGAGIALAANALPALAQDAPKPDAPLPQGGSGKLTVIHRTEYFEAAQTAFRDTVQAFADSKGVQLDISTTNPESFGDFMGKMTAAVKAGNPPDFAYTSNVSISQLHLLDLVEDVTDVVDEAVKLYGDIMPGLNAAKTAQFDGRWKAIPLIGTTTGLPCPQGQAGREGHRSGIAQDHRRSPRGGSRHFRTGFLRLGLRPNQSGDGFGFLISVVQAFGGHFTDETGLIVTVRLARDGGGVRVPRAKPTTATASMPPCCRRVSRAGTTPATTKPASPARSAPPRTPSRSTRSASATTTRSTRTPCCCLRPRRSTATTVAAATSAAG